MTDFRSEQLDYDWGGGLQYADYTICTTHYEVMSLLS